MGIPIPPKIPALPTPSALYKNVGIVLYYKDKTGFITGATVTFEAKVFITTRLQSRYNATTNGMLYYASIPKGMAINIYAQKQGIDFGKGKGAKAIVGSDTGFDSEIHKFEASTPFPCPNLTPTINTFNFSLPTAVPNISIPPLKGTIDGIDVSVTEEGIYEILFDSTPIIPSTEIPKSGKIDVNLPRIKDIPSLAGKTTTTIEVIIRWYHCTFRNTKTITLPKPQLEESPCFGELGMNLNNIYDTLSKSSTLPSSLNVPVYITGQTGNIGSTKISILVNGEQVGEPIYAGNSIDLIRILSGRVPDIATTNKIELVPESTCIKRKTFTIPPLIPTGTAPPKPDLSAVCSDIKTTVESVNHESTLPPIPSTPFFISINKIKLECPSNSALTKKMTGETGTVTLGNLSAQFPIPSPGQSDGEVYFDLAKLIDLSKIIGGTPVTTPTKETITTPSFTKKSGRFSNAATAQAYLPIGYIATPTAFGGGSYSQITRPNGSYTYARTYEELDRIVGR